MPFPLPIRVSAGLLVIGRSGKFYEGLTIPLKEREMAIRQASICREVMNLGSVPLPEITETNEGTYLITFEFVTMDATSFDSFWF